MSDRVLIIDRLLEVARQLEALAAYAVLSRDGTLEWSDPIHVMRDADVANPPKSHLVVFQELAPKAKPSGSTFELQPGVHALVLPVPVKGRHAAVSFVVVRAEDRLAYFMLQLAKLMLQRDDYFAEGTGGASVL